MLVPVTAWLTAEKPLRVMNIHTSFLVWLCFNTCVSLAAHMDIITTRVFSGRTFMSCSVPEGHTSMSATWAFLTGHSMFADYLTGVPLWAFVVAGWLLMSLQGLFAIFLAKPSTGKDENGEDLRYELL